MINDPTMSHDEMISFLYKVTGVSVSVSGINRALRAIDRSKKNHRRVARRQDAELRNLYLYRLSRYETKQLVFVDQSGYEANKQGRRNDWVACDGAKISYQIIPAYTQDGVLFSRCFKGSVTAAIFEDFIKQLLCYCERWPAPKSVLVMDDTPCHNKEKVDLLCAAAGVKLLLLPPDSADLNPVGRLMYGLNEFVEERREECKDLGQDDFEGFLGRCMGVVGSQQASARHHFQLAGLFVEGQRR